jgi:hypothetical protein
MLKTVPILTVVLAICQAAAPLPGQTGQTPDVGARSRDEAAKKTAAKKRDSPPTVTLDGPSVASAPAQNGAQQQATANEAHPISVAKFPSVSVNRDWIDCILVILNIGLLVVGISGVRAAISTLNKISRQVDLQERTMQQWVDYRNWRSEYRASDNGRQLLLVGFDVVNPTNFPVTIPSGQFSFRFNENTRDMAPSPNWRLLPNRQYPVDVWFTVTTDEAESFVRGNGIAIRVSGSLDHIGSLGKTEREPLRGTIHCHQRTPGGAAFEDEPVAEKNSQNPK